MCDSGRQHTQWIFDIAERTLDQFGDWMGAFVGEEILAGRRGDESALGVVVIRSAGVLAPAESRSTRPPFDRARGVVSLLNDSGRRDTREL